MLNPYQKPQACAIGETNRNFLQASLQPSMVAIEEQVGAAYDDLSQSRDIATHYCAGMNKVQSCDVAIQRIGILTTPPSFRITSNIRVRVTQFTNDFTEVMCDTPVKILLKVSDNPVMSVKEGWKDLVKSTAPIYT
jgi:hypothetical protein